VTPREMFVHHARPWQFGRHGRKFRVVAERLKRLASVLARFDRSDKCSSIYAAVGTIRMRLEATELNYPEDKRFKWSRRTVFVYLNRLELAGIATTSGLTRYHGTKARALHADKLLFAPVESCTLTHHESCTRIKSLEPKKSQARKKKQNHPADDAARSPLTIRATARRNILARSNESPEVVQAIIDHVWERADAARTVIRSPWYLERAFDSEIAHHAAQLERDAPDLLASAPEMRRKIAFVHAVVEQAAREGRSASAVLAGMSPP